MRGRMLLLLVVVFATGCATPYKKLSGKYGYDDFRITKDVFEISFAANQHTAASLVSRYVFRRAAEVTLLSRFTHFVPFRESDHSLYGALNTATGTTHTYGSQDGSTSWGHGSSSGMNIPFKMPAITMRVRCFKTPLPDVEKLVDAREFLRYNFPEAPGLVDSAAGQHGDAHREAPVE